MSIAPLVDCCSLASVDSRGFCLLSLWARVVHISPASAGSRMAVQLHVGKSSIVYFVYIIQRISASSFEEKCFGMGICWRRYVGLSLIIL